MIKVYPVDLPEVMYPLQPYNKEQFNAALSKFGPKGWTPLASAIESVNDDFKEYTGEENLNVVYIVSDGEETCGEIQLMLPKISTNLVPMQL